MTNAEIKMSKEIRMTKLERRRLFFFRQAKFDSLHSFNIYRNVPPLRPKSLPLCGLERIELFLSLILSDEDTAKALRRAKSYEQEQAAAEEYARELAKPQETVERALAGEAEERQPWPANSRGVTQMLMD